MGKVRMTLDECRDLAIEVLTRHGCDERNARAIAATITAAERDLDIAFRDFESELTQYADQIR